MDTEVKELFLRIEFIEKLVDFLHQSIMLTWAMLAVAVAVIAITLYTLVKKWTLDKINKELDKIKDNFDEQIKNQIFSNPQLLKAKFYSQPNEKGEISFKLDKKYIDMINNEHKISRMWTVEIEDNNFEGSNQKLTYYLRLKLLKVDPKKCECLCLIEGYKESMKTLNVLCTIYVLNDKYKIFSLKDLQ